MTWVARRAGLAGLLFVFVLAACAPQAGKNVYVPTGKDKMQEIAHMLKMVKTEGGPPTSVNDLDRVEPFLPMSANEIRSGDIVLVWGADLADGGGTKVVAYEKKAATESAWVLMDNGTPKQMSPSEFNAAPKAK